jgi:hypothetical protein
MVLSHRLDAVRKPARSKEKWALMHNEHTTEDVLALQVECDKKGIGYTKFNKRRANMDHLALADL